MCGIAGILRRGNGSIEPACLRDMNQMCKYRGPDSSGIYLDGEVGLAHVRLSILDLAGGQQPMRNQDGSLWITFSGEIFNYVELREELVQRGHKFATHSDTEVILHLYEEKGEDCVREFNGQWAFALWDARARKLFLSRDRLGVRPLFYTLTDRAFLFASEIKSLFAYPGVSREIDLEALDQVFTFWCSLPPRTIFRGVSELPPGHSLVVENGQLRLQPYWELDFSQAPATPPEGARLEQEAAEKLLELLVDATRLRLRADVPVGAYLSGGLDSTVVTALIRRFTHTPLKTFSVRFDDPEFDEGRYQDEVTRFLGTDHQTVRCSTGEIGRVFPDVIWHAEKPILRTAPAPLFLLSKLVRDAGYKVVLTGEGADEMFGGYDIFKEAKIRRFWGAQPDSRRRPLLLKRLYPYLPNLQAQSPAYLQAFFHLRPEQADSPFFSHLPRWELTARLKRFFSRAVKAQLNGADPYAELRARLPRAYSGWDGFSQAQYLEATCLLPGYILSSQGDRVAMAHSVEGRFPFLDHRVVEFAAALPPGWKMKALDEKYLLKRCADGLIPAAVKQRPKQPYRAPEARSFFDGGSPAPPDYVAELLSPERLERDALFDPAAVARLMAKARQGQLIGIKDNMALVGILSTQLLVDQFVRHFTPRTVYA